TEDINPKPDVDEYVKPVVVFRYPIQDSHTKAGVASIYVDNQFDLYIKHSKQGKIVSKIIYYENSNGEIEINWSLTDKELQDAIRNKSDLKETSTNVALEIIHSKKDELRCFITGITKNRGLDQIKEYIDNPSASDFSKPEKLVKTSEQVNNDEKKKEFFAYKYTAKSKLYEAVLIEDTPYFITISNDGRLQIIEKIEEETRIIKPPYKEDY